MAGRYNAGNVKIAPHDAYYEAKETICIGLAGLLPADLADKHFTVFDGAGVEYNVWFNLDAAGTAPAAATGTLVEVAVATGETPADVATTIGGLTIGTYVLTVDGDVVTLCAGDMLPVAQDAVDVDSGVDVSILTKGGSVFLGLIDGDISITPSTSTFDVTSHQTGTTPLAQIIQGAEATVEFTLLECTKTIYDQMIAIAGGSVFTPNGGTSVAGFGTASVGRSAVVDSRTLRLHPVSLPATDYSADWNFWKARPEIGGITLSGENPQTLPLTFTAYPDTTKQSEIDIFALGDGNQAGLSN